MIGLDTNVLVRHLVQDDPGQSRKATQRNDQRVRNAIPKDVPPRPAEMIVILNPLAKNLDLKARGWTESAAAETRVTQ